MAVSISSRRRYSFLALAGISDTVSSIPRVQWPVFDVRFSSCIGSTESWPDIRWNGEFPVLGLTVILSAQSTPGRWSIRISFGSSEQAMSLVSASEIHMFRHSTTPLAAAWYGVTVIFWILKHLRGRSVLFLLFAPPSTNMLSEVLNRQIDTLLKKFATLSELPWFSGRASAHPLRYSLATTRR